MDSTANVSFEELLAPVELSTFLSHHWLRRPLHVPGSLGKLERLFGGIPHLAQLVDIVSESTGGGSINLAAFFQSRGQVAQRDAAEDLPRMNAQPQQVRALLAAGATVAAYGIDSVIPDLARWVAQLRTRLGHAGRTSCSLWMSSPSRGLSTHFDMFSSIHVQLVGTKSWHVGQEAHVVAPSTASVVCANGMADVDMSGYSPRYEHVERASFRRITLRPGDVLFVPSGTWHATECDTNEVSVSCSFEFVHATFRDVMEVYLRDRFNAEDLWRYVPLSPPADPSAEAELTDFFAARLDETIASLSKLRQDSTELKQAWKQLIANNGSVHSRASAEAPGPAKTVHPSDILAAPPGKPITCAFGKSEDGSPILFLYQDGHVVRVRDGAFFEFCTKLVSVQLFRACEGCSWKTGSPYDWDEVQPLLEAFVERGMLRITRTCQRSPRRTGLVRRISRWMPPNRS
ncbi:cupin domain-containing protein [Pendulispora brunnea]|uniref:Cupin domain-containing protein n=1 Tax=Pendulispora brunnea TaxID=2905690 RepID=A0ABZ2KE97_9BACT